MLMLFAMSCCCLITSTAPFLTSALLLCSAHRAMSQECLRVVGAAGFLSDGEGEDAEMKEYVDADLVSTKANARSMVTSDADEISGFNILGMFACLLPDARVPEVGSDTNVLVFQSVSTWRVGS